MVAKTMAPEWYSSSCRGMVQFFFVVKLGKCIDFDSIHETLTK